MILLDRQSSTLQGLGSRTIGGVILAGRVVPPRRFNGIGEESRGQTKRFVSLFQVGREHIFDPFHECADSARQVAPMRYYEGHGKRPTTKVG
jgi:hypothetical protein